MFVYARPVMGTELRLCRTGAPRGEACSADRAGDHIDRLGVPMEIGRKSLGSVPLLEICGDIDHSTAEELHQAVYGAQDGEGRLLLDLTGCRYVDSGGLAVILSATRDRVSGGWLGVIGAGRNVTRLFHLVGLHDEPAFHQFPDLPAAEQAMLPVPGR